MQKFSTREEWLGMAVEAMRPWFAEVGAPLPEKVRASVGFPVGSSRSRFNIIGQCWASRASEDGINALFITPTLKDAGMVLGVLVHELIHAADDCKSGHKGEFKRVALALGLTGKMTATTVGEALKPRLEALADDLGEYPHGAMNPLGRIVQADPKPGEPGDGEEEPPIVSGPKKQTTRLKKAGCEECGYTIRVTEKWLAVGLPVCPCGTPMVRQ